MKQSHLVLQGGIQHQCRLLWMLLFSVKAFLIYNQKSKWIHLTNRMQVLFHFEKNCTLSGNPKLHVLQTAYTCSAWRVALLKKSQCSSHSIVQQKKLHAGGILHMGMWMLQYKPVDTMVICVSFHSAGRIQFLFLNNIFPGLTIVSLSELRSVIMGLYLFSSQRTMHLHYFSIVVLLCAEYVLSMLQPQCCSMSEYFLMNMLNRYIALCWISKWKLHR